MKRLNYGHCLIGVAIAAILLILLGVQASTLVVLAAVLICPVMMFVMMKTMMRGQHGPSDHSNEPVGHSKHR